MAVDRSITVKLHAEVNQFVAGMKQASKAADEVAKSAEAIGPKTDKASTALGKLEANVQKNEKAYRLAGGALLAFGAGTVALGAAALKTGIAYNTLQQTSRAALKTLLGSAKAANIQMDALDDFARNSPFAKEVFIKAQQQLIGFGFAAKDVVPTLDAIQNAVAAVGGGNQDIAEIANVLAKVSGTGKITAETLNELGIRGVDAATIIGEQMGLTGAQIRDSITSGALDADTAIAALTKGMTEKFAGAADSVKDTFAGSMDRIRAAWRDFSGELAAPIVNPKGGGFGIDVLNGLADMMRGFIDLPGPVKVAASALTGIVGVTSLAAGGFLLLLPRIVETRLALAEMGVTTQMNVGRLGAVATTARKAAVSIALLAAAQKGLESITQRSAADIDGLVGDLERLGSSGKAVGELEEIFGKGLKGTERMGRDIRSVGEAVKEFDKYGDDNFLTRLTRRTVLAPFTSGVYQTANGIRDLDAAFVKFSKNDPKAAMESFGELRDRVLDTGGSVKELERAFPGMTEVLRSASEAAGGTSDSAKVLAGELSKLPSESQAAAEAMAQMKQATAESAMSFLDFSAGIDDANFTIDTYIRGVEEMAAAQANWADNMIKATARGVDEGVIAKFQEMGPAGAKALEELADGSQKNIDRLNAAFAQGVEGADRLAETLHGVPPEVLTQFAALGIDPSVDAVMALQRKYNLTPEQVSTIMTALDIASPKIQTVLYRMAGLNRTSASPKISVATAQAYAAIAGVQRQIKNVKGKTVAIHIQSIYGGGRTTADADGSIRRYFADGGIAGGEDHRAAIYKPTPKNAVRFFAEEETGGEAYIPLANDHRRPRALAIWEETGRLLGAKVFADGAIARYATPAQHFATGGMASSGPASTVPSGSAFASQAAFGKQVADLAQTVAGLHKQIQRVSLEDRDVKALASQIGGAVSSGLKSSASSSQHAGRNQVKR